MSKWVPEIIRVPKTPISPNALRQAQRNRNEKAKRSGNLNLYNNESRLKINLTALIL